MSKFFFIQKILCLLLIISAYHVSAQTPVAIKGVVKDERSGERLIGAAVSIKGTSTGTATDFDGNFTLRTTNTFPLVLLVTYVGYENVEITVSDASKQVDVRMKEATQTLRDVVITDTRVSEKQKQNPITVETMDAIAIKQTPAANFYEGLAHLKGVDLTSASIGFKIINTRGFNSTSPVRSLQLIDGVDNQSPGLNFSLGNFLGASELDIQKVDLIVGASSAYYGPNAFNGVINMQTKSPFLYPGLSASVKAGERDLVETSVRWAQVFKDKKGEDRYAYKLNVFFMRANDWKAENYQPTLQSPTGKGSPGGYDAVNVYGDEYVNRRFYQAPDLIATLGYGYSLRNGYKETDLVDYNSRNLKLSGAFHYKLKKDVELIYASSFGTGTTVYQGDNRFSLKDILFFQNRAEIRKEDKFFIRIYATNEDAGKSYDAYSTAIRMQEYSKSDNNWALDYQNAWSSTFGSYIVGDWYNYYRFDTVPTNRRFAYMQNFVNTYLVDSMIKYHNLSRDRANTLPGTNGTGLPRYEPGTARFDSAFNAITSRTNREGGSRLFDQSALYHIAAEYKFNTGSFTWTTGGNFRLYAPYSKGTIFLDTAENQRIYNREGGAYIGVEKKFFDNTLKVSTTHRIDKNENFKLLWSPAATAVYSKGNHVIRFSLSSAIRNPTLSDQYINLNVGRATLIGNLHGFDSLVTTESFIEALNNGKDKLVYFNIDPVKPERVKTIEVGYRLSIGAKVFLDMSYYHSWYTDFLGYKIGAKLDWPSGDPFVRSYEVYRVTTNSKDIVTTQGATIGANYFYQKYLGFNVNYSWNKLDRKGSTDPVIPAFNTPEHKYNLGISGRDIISKIFGLKISNWGYSINYKWQDGFMFEGSPQFTGYVPAYDMVDAQVNKRWERWYTTLKVGANNLLDNRVYQVYGGPLVGRLAYISVLIELSDWK